MARPFGGGPLFYSPAAAAPCQSFGRVMESAASPCYECHLTAHPPVLRQGGFAKIVPHTNPNLPYLLTELRDHLYRILAELDRQDAEESAQAARARLTLLRESPDEAPYRRGVVPE